jgi:hypothetical protein
MHTCVRTYIHTYVHTFVHTYIHKCIHAYVHTHTHTHTYTHACTHTHTHTHTEVIVTLHHARCNAIYSNLSYKNYTVTSFLLEFILGKLFGYCYNAMNSLGKSFVCLVKVALCQHLSVGLTGLLAGDRRMYLCQVFYHSDLCLCSVFIAKMCSPWTGQ